MRAVICVTLPRDVEFALVPPSARTGGRIYAFGPPGLAMNYEISPEKRATGFARQDVKERGERDDAGRRSDDSYSPRRHWCSMFKPDGEAWVRGLRTDV